MERSGSTSLPPSGDELRQAVGPVLTAGPLAAAVIAALRAANEKVTVVDRGAYLRVLVPRRCRLDAALVAQTLAAPFTLPGDLEAIMPSFRGRLRIEAGEAIWELGGAW
jgi:toluene monooxygenase system protein D